METASGKRVSDAPFLNDNAGPASDRGVKMKKERESRAEKPMSSKRNTVNDHKKELDFLISSVVEENPYMAVDECLEWIDSNRKKINVHIKRIPFAEMKGWRFEKNTDNLFHESGKFFSIEGIDVRTNWGGVPHWMQPIIFQPEIGLLGIITRKINGILYFLMQVKIEPGNINIAQLSPTVQATRSNYTRAHGGKKTAYLEYFTDGSKCEILIDQLQSEQGARFYRKRNRNIIVKVEEDIPVYENFCWLTLCQIKKLMKFDNVVNMDARTVISGIPYGSYNSEILVFHEMIERLKNNRNNKNTAFFISLLDDERHLFSIDRIFSWITDLKTKYYLETRRTAISKTARWKSDEHSIFHESGAYFSVIGTSVEIEGREVEKWRQPMLKPSQQGVCTFLVKMIHGVLHFLVQAKMEPGNLDILEMAPTVQCITGSYLNTPPDKRPPYLNYVLNAPSDRILYRSAQSEEGGRFYHESNVNSIIEVDENFPVETPPTFIWMTLNQLGNFIRYNNYINIQARSILSSLRFL